MAAPETQKTPDETIALITETKAQRGDKFLVKVGKRRGAAGVFETIAELVNATAFQLSSPEPWLNQLCGGGEYRLQAYHMDAPTVPIGGKIPATISGQNLSFPNARVMEAPEWLGPSGATFLAGGPAPAFTQAFAPAFAPQAPQQFQPPAGAVAMAGNGQPVQGYGPVVVNAGGNGQGQPQFDYRAHIEQKERDLAAREARMLREASEREADIRRQESEQKLREENARALRELELKMQAATAQSAARVPDTSWVKELIIGLVPLASTLIQTSNTRAELALKLQLDAQERADKRAAEERAETRKVLEAITNKPTGMSEEQKLLFETLRSQGNAGTEMMSRFMDAANMITKNSVSMIETISSIKFGEEPESPTVQVIREGAAALRTVFSGANATARRSVQQQQMQQQLPYSTAATQPVPQQIPPVANPATVQPQAGQAFNGMPPVQGQPSQAQPSTQLAPSIDLQTARLILNRGQPPGPNDDPLAVLEIAIKAHHAPTEVAAYLFASAKHPKVLVALREVNNEVDDLFKARLGNWMDDPVNIPYILQLGATLDHMGQQLGLYEPETDGPDDDDDGTPEEIPPPAQV